MKKTPVTLCCAIGSGVIGYFANQLNTALGALCFVLGVFLLAGSVIAVFKGN